MHPSFMDDVFGSFIIYSIFFLLPFWLLLKFLERFEIYAIYKLIIATLIAFNIPLFGVHWLFASILSYGKAMKTTYTYEESIFHFPYMSFQLYTLPIYSILVIIIVIYLIQFKVWKKYV
jgi:hypothetical protein